MADVIAKEITRKLEFEGDLMNYFHLCRSKHHLYDLTYIEKVARLITNTEVKIKAEVSDYLSCYQS